MAVVPRDELVFAPEGRQRRRPSGAGVNRQENRFALLMLAPLVIMLGIFVIWPLIYSGYLSFFNWSFYEASTFVGWRNFSNVLTDDAFVSSVLRGLRFTAIVVPTVLVLAFLFASLVKGMGRKIATTLKISIYIPTVISGVITSIIFVLIYEYPSGLANWVLDWFGIEPLAWIGDVNTALISIAIPTIWLGTGISSLIMLAAMLDIPESYYEAAELEGANWWQRSWYITIPLLRNIFLFLLVTGFVATIQQFEIPLVMTNGGPLDSTLLPNLLIFNHFRQDLYVGYSIAAAFLMAVIMSAISAVIFKVISSQKAVDG